jgi:hypothetical protein
VSGLIELLNTAVVVISYYKSGTMLEHLLANQEKVEVMIKTIKNR